MDNSFNKYLIFNLENEHYAIPIAKVQEVISYVPITSLHEASDFLKGVINLRGKIIPIIDMRIKFGMPEKPYTERTIFIIVDVVTANDIHLVGLIVDAVRDVVEIPQDKIEKTPEVGFKLKSRYLQGIIQLQDSMIMILNLDTILAVEDVIELTEKAAVEA